MLTHDTIERKPTLLIILVILVVAVGGLVEIVPLSFMKSMTEPVAKIAWELARPWTREAMLTVWPK